MKARVLLAGLVLVGFAGTAMADEYYIVKEPNTKKCTIVNEKPDTKVTVTQIGPLAFKTREEAENRIKQTKVCTED